MNINVASVPVPVLVPQLRFGRAQDAVGLVQLRPAVARVVHLQAVVQLVQVLLHLLDLLPGHVLQAKTNLGETHGGAGDQHTRSLCSFDT